MNYNKCHLDTKIRGFIQRKQKSCIKKSSENLNDHRMLSIVEHYFIGNVKIIFSSHREFPTPRMSENSVIPVLNMRESVLCLLEDNSRARRTKCLKVRTQNRAPSAAVEAWER